MDDQERLSRARAIAVTSGRSQEHLRFVIEHMDRQMALVTARAEDAEREVEFMAAHSGVEQIRALEQERTDHMADIDRLRQIYTLAVEWGTAAQNLEASRKKGDDNKGGEGVYKSNQAFTKSHLALREALKSHIKQS